MADGAVKGFDEIYGGAVGWGGIAVGDRDDDADQGSVGAVQSDGVGDDPEFGGVFAGYGAVAGLIPVQNQAARFAVLNYIAVYRNRRGCADVDGNSSAASSGVQPLPGRQFLGEWGAFPLRWERKAAMKKSAARFVDGST